jgi:hypothetical protein
MTELPIDVVRSKRRKRTVQAYLSEGRLRVLMPADLSPDEEAKLIETMVARATRRLSSFDVDLESRGRALAARYGLPVPTSIDWSDRQMRRWGSCSPSTGSVRISSRLASMPGWVLDWVIVHELAHLEAPDHGSRFRELVDRYELSERAKGYLMAVSDLREEPSVSS